MHRLARLVLGPLLLALHCGGAFAQAPAACPPPTVPPSAEALQALNRDARDHGFLWRISKDGRSSHLYGTLHLGRFEWMFPGPRLRQALDASDAIALELDLLAPEIQQRMARAIAARAAAALPEALRRRLDRRAEAECIAPAALAALGPELQVAALMGLAGRRDGLAPDYGIDAVLSGWGRAAGKPVVSLETPELQLAALQSGSPAETVEFVTSALDALDAGRARPSLRRLAQVWADAELAPLTDYAAWCDCVNTAADRAALARLIDDRNPALADAIDALHTAGQRVFAGVGSLHMVGPHGLPALLAARGYRVERVVFPR